jgi:hypothetical protein
MKVSNIARVIISYLFLIAAFSVYFIWSYIWLEAIFIFCGLIILLSAIHLHRKDKRAQVLKKQQEAVSNEEKISKGGLPGNVSAKKLAIDDQEETDVDEEVLSVGNDFTVEVKDSEEQTEVEDAEKEEPGDKKAMTDEPIAVESDEEEIKDAELTEVEPPEEEPRDQSRANAKKGREKKVKAKKKKVVQKKDTVKDKKPKSEKAGKQPTEDNLKEIEEIWEEVEKK